MVGGIAAFTFGVENEGPASEQAQADDEITRDAPGAMAASRSQDRAALAEAMRVELVIDGESEELTVRAATVADVLEHAEVNLNAEDEVSEPLDAPVSDGDTITIETVGTQTVHERERDEYDTVEEDDPTLPRGEREVETEGVDGVVATTHRVTRTSGQESDRELVARVVVTERVDEVVRVGTAEPEPSTQNGDSDASSSSTDDSGSSASSSSSDDGDSSASSSSSNDAPAAPSGDPKAIAEEMLADRGWGADEFQCLDQLWNKESGWNVHAQNASSGAYGIPQALPGSKMASAGSDWQSNAATQISWGLDYIQGRYGSPCGAWSHSQANNWY